MNQPQYQTPNGNIVVDSNQDNNPETYCSQPYIRVGNNCCLDTNNNKIYLKNKTSSNFLGFPKDYNNKEILITTNGLYSYQPVNVIYHQQLLINIDTYKHHIII
jgi:hypothetical protein